MPNRVPAGIIAAVAKGLDSLNPRLTLLQPYPFERLRKLVSTVVPDPKKAPINLSIGEPRHPTPRLVLDALAAGATTGLAHYPTTVGAIPLREAIGRWLRARHHPSALDPAAQVLLVLGGREGLFSLDQSGVEAIRAC